MWVSNVKIQQREFESMDGRPYTAYEITGIKKGYNGAPDEEWSKKVFESDAATVIENGVARPGISVVSFFKNAVKESDTVSIKQERAGKFWKINELSIVGAGNKGVAPAPYVPLEASQSVSEASQQATTEATDTPPWAE